MTPTEKTPAKKAPAKKVSAKKVAAKKTPARKKAPAKKASAEEKTPAKKAPARKKAPAKMAPAEKAPATDEAPTEDAVPETPGQPSAVPWDDEPDDEIIDDTDEDLWGADWDDLDAFADPTADPGRFGSESRDDPAHHLASEGVELFQTAALELIAAARNALDAAEELVSDPKAIPSAFESLRELASEAFRAAKPGRTRPAPDDGFEAIRVDDD